MEVILDDARLMEDKFFLISQSDHVREKFLLNGEEEPSSIAFPGIDRVTWNHAMRHLEPDAWVLLMDSDDDSALKTL